jgi:hypothetical protein
MLKAGRCARVVDCFVDIHAETDKQFSGEEIFVASALARRFERDSPDGLLVPYPLG